MFSDSPGGGLVGVSGACGVSYLRVFFHILLYIHEALSVICCGWLYHHFCLVQHIALCGDSLANHFGGISSYNIQRIM